MASSQLMQLVPPLGGLLAGSAVSSFVLKGARFTDVMFAFDGALGAAVGLLAGNYIAPQLPVSLDMVRPYTGLILAVAVPSLVSGKADSTSLIVGVSVYAGAYVTSTWVLPMLQKKNGADPASAGAGASGK